MRVFAVSGYSGTGKTSLIEAIIKSLVSDGYTVATIKSSIHEAGQEQGADTWKHLQAGASKSVFLGPNTKSTKFKDRIGLEELVDLSKFDFLIVEGMKSVDIPRFWCVGDRDMDLIDVPSNTQAIVSWSIIETEYRKGIPIIHVTNIDELVDIVKSKSVSVMEID